MKFKSICLILSGIILVGSAYGQNIAVNRSNKQVYGEIKNYSSILELAKTVFQSVKEKNLSKLSSAFMSVGDYAGVLRNLSTQEQQKCDLAYKLIKNSRSSTE